MKDCFRQYIQEGTILKEKVAWVCIGLSVAILIHHKIISGLWFNIGDITNHEFFAIALACFGLGIVIGER